MIRKSELSHTTSSFDYIKALVQANLATFKPETKTRLQGILAKQTPTPEEKAFLLDCVEYGKG